MIDDRIGVAATRQACWLDIFVTVRIVCALGFQLGLAKCVLWPCQRSRYLGMMLALDTLHCSVPDLKLQRFVQTVDAVGAEVISARQLASISGMLISFSPAIPLGKLYTQQLFWALSGRASWDEAFPVGSDLRQHLAWLRGYVSGHNGQRCPGTVLVTDASVKGVGGFTTAAAGVQVTLQGQLPEQLFVASNTCRGWMPLIIVGDCRAASATFAHPRWWWQVCYKRFLMTGPHVCSYCQRGTRPATVCWGCYPSNSRPFCMLQSYAGGTKHLSPTTAVGL